MLLSLYFLYVFLCAMYGRMMDKVCPSYGKANQIGFAEMGAATTSFDAADNTTRPTIDGFEAYKKNRQLQNKRTLVARQLVGSILRGEVQYDHLVGNVQPSSDDQTEQDTLSETLADGAGDSRANHGKHAQEIFDSKLFHDSITSLDQVEDESSEPSSPPQVSWSD